MSRKNKKHARNRAKMRKLRVPRKGGSEKGGHHRATFSTWRYSDGKNHPVVVKRIEGES